jgi:hypothetical protein
VGDHLTLHVPKIGADLAGEVGVDLRGENAAGQVVADELEALDVEIGDGDLAAAFEEEAAGEPFKGGAAEDVSLGRAEGAAGELPVADEGVQATQGGVGGGGCGGVGWG